MSYKKAPSIKHQEKKKGIVLKRRTIEKRIAMHHASLSPEARDYWDKALREAYELNK